MFMHIYGNSKITGTNINLTRIGGSLHICSFLVAG